MSQKDKKDAANLEWLVRCRSQNQRTSLVLYKLMMEDLPRLKKENDLSDAAIALIAISFNLWRAVFLVDDTDRQSERLDHAIAFLKTLISDNAIAYLQDKNSRAWSCMSYLNNARYRLVRMSDDDPAILPNFSNKIPKTMRDYWEHLQTNADLAVANLANAIKKAPQSN